MKSVSIHAPAEPTGSERPQLSLDLLRPSTKISPGDNESWTPSAAVVEQMGHLSVAELVRLTGRSEKLIRRAMDRLGVKPTTSASKSFDGAALRAARKAKGLTAAKLAELAGIGGGRAYISQLEAGKRVPTQATVDKLTSAMSRSAET